MNLYYRFFFEIVEIHFEIVKIKSLFTEQIMPTCLVAVILLV